MKEEWKVIEEFPDYMVSNLGRIKNISKGRERILKKCKATRCNTVGLHRDLKCYYRGVAKIVAKAFVPNPDPINLNCLTHSNGDSFDDRAENLVWINRANVCASRKLGKKVKAINSEGNELLFYSVLAACRYFSVKKYILHAIIKYDGTIDGYKISYV